MKTYKLVLAVLGAVMLFGLLMLAVPVADAQLKVTNVVYTWHYTQNKYVNSLAVVPWDGGWQPFIYRLDDEFNTDVFISNTLQTTNYGITNTNSRYSGLMDYGVYHEDIRPAPLTPGAPGFRTTRRWSLVWCDRTGDGNFTNADQDAPNPTEYYSTYKIEDLPIVFQNVLVLCSTGNCYDELVTRLFVSLDRDNSGIIDPAFRVGGVIGGAVRPVCFYAEAQRPSQTVVTWTGNPQARVSAGGGEKTVNFSPTPGGATAVTLSSFDAGASSNTVIPMGMVIPGVLGLISAVAAVGVWKFARRAR